MSEQKHETEEVIAQPELEDRSDQVTREDACERSDEPQGEAVAKGGKKKIAALAVAAAVVCGLGIGCWYALGTDQARPVAQEQEAASGKTSVADALANEPRPVGVSIKADGWKPENGALTLVIRNAEGNEEAKLAVMPESNGGMSAKDAIEALPEDQFDAARKAYKKDDGIAESPVLKLEPGDYTAELADMPTLEDGSTYKLPDAASFKVEPMKKKGDESIAAKIEFSLEKIDPEDETAVNAAIEALPEEKREAARQQYQKKAEQKQHATSGGGTASGSTGGANSGSSSGSGSGNNGGGSSSGGGSSEPQPPAHTHVYDTPIVESRWQDGEGYQRVTRIICRDCGAVFSSWDACSAHITEMVLNDDPVHITGTSLDDSYDTWTKEPGYYDVVVGYKCSCGARR